jgi:hypothetical protein
VACSGKSLLNQRAPRKGNEMTEQKEVRIAFADLFNVVVECACGAELSIDFSKEEARKVDWDHSESFACPACHKTFDSNLRLGFSKFLDWQDTVIESKQRISFRVKIQIRTLPHC